MPEQTGGAHLGDFEIEVHPDGPEEGQTTRKGVDIHAGSNPGAHVFHAVSQRESQFDGLVGAGFLDVVTRDRDRVELRHVLRGVTEDVGDDLHRRLGRIDVGIPHHEFFEDVVLDRARQLVLRYALFFGSNDVTGQDRQHGTVHGHRNGDLVERDAVEEDLHVFDRIDRHTSLADIANDAGIIGIVTTVSGQVESHGNALAAGG